MTKQVLSIEQMQHLQELGLELKKDTILVWTRFMLGKTQISDWEIAYNHSAITENSQIIPAYTLQDVLDALPIHKLCVKRIVLEGNRVMYAVSYENKDYADWHESLIDAAYSLLCWAIENGYVETNKSE